MIPVIRRQNDSRSGMSVADTEIGSLYGQSLVCEGVNIVKQSIPAQSRARGFSLIELLIVVAIIGIIAAIAVPNLINARQSAKTASVVGALRVIHSSELSYRSANDRYADLATLGNSGFISDDRLRNGQKARYTFVVTPDVTTPSASYSATATPSDPSLVPAWRHYYIDQTGVIHWKAGAPADATSQALD